MKTSDLRLHLISVKLKNFVGIKLKHFVNNGEPAIISQARKCNIWPV